MRFNVRDLFSYIYYKSFVLATLMFSTILRSARSESSFVLSFFCYEDTCLHVFSTHVGK